MCTYEYEHNYNPVRSQKQMDESVAVLFTEIRATAVL